MWESPPQAVCHVVREWRSCSEGGDGNACMLDLFQKMARQFRRDLTVKPDRLKFFVFSWRVTSFRHLARKRIAKAFGWRR